MYLHKRTAPTDLPTRETTNHEMRVNFWYFWTQNGYF